MFGGISGGLLNDMHTFDFKTEKWTKESQKGSYEIMPDNKIPEEDKFGIDLRGKVLTNIPEKRFGHSLVPHKDMLILYGGEEKYNKKKKKRDMFNDLYIFRIKDNVWKKVHWREKVIYGRKHHASTIIGRSMVIHGGLIPSNNVVDEFLCLDVTTSKWSDVK